ncbi:glycoside hydrolase family 1 protein [Steroidobacter flavus]|uniref:Glycoside hydrolase family 1 protein n=1 Tax=Steroidobacter flavus TaxID=1842136 RepID=A0ABV8SY79_9GAMM
MGAMAARPRNGSFPKGFLWGAATSGHQIEGNNVNADIWVVENVKPTIYAERSADAANSFELWPQDLELVKEIGLNSYRFSLEWSRIEPDEGQFSIAALDHYKRIIDGCREHGITPAVTFNHYTTPRWFAARGGWTKQDAPQLFARFCDRAARRLAEGIGYATTLNEPNLIAVLRFAALAEQLDKLMPYVRAMNEAAARAVGSEQFVTGNTISVDDVEGLTQTLIAGHRAGREAIKAVRTNLPVGVSLAVIDDQAVERNSIRDSMRKKLYGAWLEAVQGDDFLGVQNYERHLWDAKGTVAPPPGDRNAAGGEVYAASLAGAVRYAHSVTGVPIIVTEHGVNTEDDALRARFIPAALSELKKTIDEGVPILGYFHWSLIDNFEWLYGYKPKYGLASVDRQTFKRTLKPSAQVYGAIARRNAL